MSHTHTHGGRKVAQSGFHSSFTYCSPPHVGRMWEMHIVEQEQDRVQGVILFRLTFFTSPEDDNTQQTNNINITMAGGDPETTATGVQGQHLSALRRNMASYLWLIMALLFTYGAVTCGTTRSLQIVGRLI